MASSQAETLELLIEIGRLLSSKLDVGELLETVLVLAARVVGAESASVLLLDEQTQELYFHVALGLGERTSGLRLKLGQGVAGHVAKMREPSIINDVHADPRWSSAVDSSTGFHTRSILAAPMILKGKIIGVVEAINKREGTFTAEDLKTFEAFASQASIAIENARLFSSLKEEKFRLDTIFAQMQDGAVLTDQAGAILMANPAAKKYMGVGTEPKTLDEATSGMTVAPSWSEIMTSQADAFDFTASREQPKKLFLAGKATRIHLNLERKAGEEPLAGWLCVFRDQTEEWRKERLKRTFLSLISHKLKTPLSSVMGYAEILKEEFKAGQRSDIERKALQAITTQGHKLADLVDKLLRYTILANPEDSMEAGPCRLDAVVDEALKSMKAWLASRKATVLWEPGGSHEVTGDAVQLKEVVKSLVENAVKFDPKIEKKVALWLEGGANEVYLRVKDLGPGIPPEEQDKIFSRFHQIEDSFTGQVEGWGLGLPYVKKIVEGHGGRVELKSKLQEGTTVTVILPRRRDGGTP
ncbi:MAG: GAF domain-containing protein [Elusimicrobia bacterium]|nr:GAF domain-containing protein [Elusimicrobiota bacterium]